MTGLSYGETARLGDTVTVTPRSSGEYVGAANWHFEVNAGATHPSVALLGCAGGKGGKGGGGGGGRVAGRGGGALSQGSAGLASPAPFSAVYVTCGRGWSRPALLRWRHPLGLHEQSRAGAEAAGGGGSSGGGKHKEPQRVELACGALIFPDVYCGEQDGERAAGPGAGLVRVLRSSRRHPQLEQSGGHERSNTRIDESKEGKESTGENTKGSESRNGPVSSADTTGQPQQQSAPRRQKKEKEATALDAALESCAYVESVIHRGGKVRYYWTRPVVRILLYGVNVFWCCVCRGKSLYSSILMSEGVPVLSPSPLDSLKWIHDWLRLVCRNYTQRFLTMDTRLLVTARY